MNAPPAARRARRLGLYGPLVTVAIGAVIWSGCWMWLRGQTLHRLSALAKRQAAAGGGFTWSGLRVYGYPFRLDLAFTDVAWTGPDGWGASAPSLLAETFVFAPDHWVAMARNGATVLRPNGPASLSARVLRASLSGVGASPPTFSLEGLGLIWAPRPGSAPTLFQSAAELHVHTRAGPNDQGAFYFEIDEATPSPDGPLGRAPAPTTFVLDAIYTHASALGGRGLSNALRSWSAASGKLDVRALRLDLGGAALRAAGKGLTLGGDGRLSGALTGTLANSNLALATLAGDGLISPIAGRAAAAALPVTATPIALTFAAGRTHLGPIDLAAAPKLY